MMPLSLLRGASFRGDLKAIQCIGKVPIRKLQMTCAD